MIANAINTLARFLHGFTLPRRSEFPRHEEGDCGNGGDRSASEYNNPSI
jgi:hypothetical protein